MSVLRAAQRRSSTYVYGCLRCILAVAAGVRAPRPGDIRWRGAAGGQFTRARGAENGDLSKNACSSPQRWVRHGLGG